VGLGQVKPYVCSGAMASWVGDAVGDDEAFGDWVISASEVAKGDPPARELSLSMSLLLIAAPVR